MKIIKLPRLSRTLVLVLAGVLAVLASGLGATTAYAYAGDVPRGTTVLGVDLGAKSHDAARQTLQEALEQHADELAAPVPVRVGEVELELDPAEIGLAVDVDATVAAAAERVGPFAALFGTRDVPPVVTVDEEALEEELAEPAAEAGASMTMPEITFEGTEPVPVYPEPGLGLDQEQTVQALAEGWPQALGDAGGWRQPGVVALPLVEIHPVTTAEEVDRLVTEVAEPAVAAPVAVTSDGQEWQVPPAAIAASLDLTADKQGEIVPRIDDEALREALAEELDEIETAPVDATVALRSGEPTVVESEDGEAVEIEALADELLAVVSEPAPRTVAAEMTTVSADFTTADAEDLGIREQVSSFTTNFEGGLSTPRNHNIATVADMVDGAVVLPGETFSLNGYTGERGYDEGFQDAPVILDGRLQPAVGGGISQFTTTLFNASYYAGLEDVEHHPHSYHYSRYPAVIEATIFYPSLDMQFRNDTQYGVLIDTSYDDDSITVSMWSTKVWDDVTTEWSDRREVTEPERRYVEPDDTCIETQGIEGFTQDAWRIFHRDGIEVNREKFTWTYSAQPEVICGEDPDDD
ncbi:VanW family protein [Natronosporangium hydrolyticum]|uniref:VanW family protein n=1 Tax=Natronosporangium hydrolyticum TaxID=2811111 RepID=A0A895Y817_9ACTN|nr:VanW family protein [Natronosporangium hydrolyticum]QSB13857.1 VanW family protein [Natronosporangium hydrolyticum]